MSRVEKIFKSMSLKEKINQMFILGFDSENLEDNPNLINLLNKSLGGVILFAKNITSYEQCLDLNKKIVELSNINPFISIDQEGGLVDRFINIEDKYQIEFISPMLLGLTENETIISKHTEIKAELLKYLGFNMNYDPLLDVNSNNKNPIISIRALSDNTEKVCKYAPLLYGIQEKFGIIPVIKHFPGHGEASIDSHLNMPIIDLPMNLLESIHIKPFKEAINNGIDAIMVAHVNYKSFEPDGKTPASLSIKILNDYLKNKLGFNGLIISDDMTMGGVTKGFNKLYAVKKAIEAGVNTFIYQHSDILTVNLLDELEIAVINGEVDEELINFSVLKILKLKEKYNLLEKTNITHSVDFEKILKLKNEIEMLADNSVKYLKKSEFNKTLKTLIIMPDKKEIFNFSKDKDINSFNLNLNNYQIVKYSLKRQEENINLIVDIAKQYEQIIFVSYNSAVFESQINLFEKLKFLPITTVICGNLSDENIYKNSSVRLILAGSLNNLTLFAALRLLDIFY